VAGLLVNRANVEEIFRNIRTTFRKAFEAVETKYQMFATILDTNQIVEKMDWIGHFPNWRKWFGDKQI